MDISKRISEIRESKGITQTELARRLDMEQSNYSRLEKRGNKLTYELIEKIAAVLEVSVFELLGKEIDPQTERIQQLEKKNAELREKLKEALPLRSQMENFESQLNVYRELFKQTKQRNREVRLWAADLVTSLESGDSDTLEKAVRFIKSVYLSDDESSQS